jgi:nicotinate-nucleotide pyrophosphorylase (carboxylating)
MNPPLFSETDSLCGSPLAAVSSLIQLALDEDLGRGRTAFPGDHSSLSCFSVDQQGRAVLRAKEAGIVAGLPLVPFVLQAVDPKLHWEALAQDGDAVEPGQAVGRAHGPLVGLLTAERTLLNFVQRLSGVATSAHRWTALVAGTGVKLLDTRKTTPGWRDLEKYAVRTGGGTNHRHGLYDLIMLKDNHIDFCGGLPEAVQRAQHYLKKLGHPLKIEVEARSTSTLHSPLPGLMSLCSTTLPPTRVGRP